MRERVCERQKSRSRGMKEIMESVKDASKHGAKSRLNYTFDSVGCRFHRMDVPSLCPRGASPAPPESIAASAAPQDFLRPGRRS